MEFIPAECNIIGGDSAHKIENDKADPPQKHLEVLPENVEQKHVVEKMADSRMEKHGRDKSPPFTVPYGWHIGSAGPYEDCGILGTSEEDLNNKKNNEIGSNQRSGGAWNFLWHKLLFLNGFSLYIVRALRRMDGYNYTSEDEIMIYSMTGNYSYAHRARTV
jgi:hypothetical protein